MTTLNDFMSTSVDLAKYNQERLKEAKEQEFKLPEQQTVDEWGDNTALQEKPWYEPSNERMTDNLLHQGQVDGVDPEMFSPGTEAGNNLGELRKTRAYELYAYTDEQKLSQAQKMGKDLNMDPALILYDDETYSKTIDMWNIGRGARSLADEGEAFDLEKVYAKHPALKAVAEKDMYAGAEALHNLKATEKLESLAEIIKYASDMNDLSLRAHTLSEKYIANQGRNAEIDKEYEAILTEREKLAKLLPDFGEDVLTRIMAESAVQLPMLYRIGKRTVEGATRGAAVGGIAGATMAGVGAVPGAMTGAVWGMKAGMFTGSYEEMLSEEVLKFAYDGNNRSFENTILTARASSAAQAAIESLSVGRFLRIVGGGKATTEAAKGIGEATFGMTLKQGAKSLAVGTAKETAGESLEEAEQDLASNVIGRITAPKEAKTMTVSEMMKSAGDNFIQALAPSFGLGLVPGVMSTIPAVRRGAQIAAERGKVNMGVAINSRFGDYVNTALKDKNVMEFFHKNPEAASAITAETLKEQGIKSVSIDVAGIMEQKNGKEIMETIAQKEKITAEELEAAISGGDNMQVNVETFMQVAAQFEGQNITDFANVAGKDAPNMYRMKQVQEALKSIQNFNATKTEETLVAHAQAFYDNYQDVAGKVDGLDSAEVEAIGRKLIGEIARTNPEDFKTGIETVLNGLEVDGNERKVLDNMAPALKDLAEDYALTGGLSKEGIAVYRNTLQSLENASSKAKQSAKASAILVARRAEMFARTMQEMGNQEYTALDYMKRFEVNANAKGKIGDYAEVEYIKNNLYTQSITGNEFGSYKDDKDLRKKADDFYRNNLQGTSVYNAAIGEIRLGKGLNRNKMRFSARGRNKMLSTGAKESKMLAVKYLKEIIENSNFVTEKEAQSEKHSKENFYYLYSKLSIGENDTRYVVVSIKEDQNKILTYYNHNVYTVEEYKKIEDTFASHDASPTMSGQNAEVSSFSNSITGKPTNGKQNIVYKSERLEIPDPYSLTQNHNFRVRGSTSFMPDGKAIINLFTRATYKTAPADQSTLPHEFGHMFLRDLEELAEMPNAPEQILKDWATVKAFLKAEDGKITRKQHEQFARHFEAYLMNGQAPTKELRNVFRNFKKWLIDIYNNVKTLLSIEGGATQLNPDMKAVFDRMLVSETEIEAAATNHDMLLQNLSDIVGSDASVQLVQEWMDDAKASAKESMLAGLMKDLSFWKGQTPEDVKAAARATAEENMRNNAYYKVSILADELKTDVVDARNQLGITIDEMKEATEFLRKNGYDLNNINDAVDKEAVRIEAMGKGILKTDEEIRQMAEESLSEHLEEVAALEELLLAEHMNDYRSAQGIITSEIEKETAELKGDPKQADFKKKIEKLKERNQARVDKLKEQNKEAKGEVKHSEANLKYQERYLTAEHAMLEEIQKAKDAKHVDEIVAKYKEKVYQERWRVAEANLRADAQKGINDKHREIVRQYRDAVRGMSEQIKSVADDILVEHRIGEAMDYKMWQRIAEHELRNSIQLMSKAITMAGRDVAKSNELMNKARDERRKYSLHLRMANQSLALNRKLLKRSDRIKKRTTTMKKGKNVSARCRYVENKLLYMFGFTKKQDTNVPVDADVNLLEWPEVLAAFSDGDGNIALPERIVNTIKNGDRLMWRNMTLGEYQDLMNVLDFVYTLGKIEMGDHKMRYADSNGKTLTIKEAIESIEEDFAPLTDIKGVHGFDETNKAGLVKEYAKKAHAELVKPDVVLRALGQKIYDTIYVPFKRATDKEANMREQMQKDLNEYGKLISDKDKFTNECVLIIDSPQGPQRLTREKIVMLALNYGTEKNAQRLQAGHGFTDKQLQEAFTHLTESDVEFVNNVWGMYDKYWHESAAMEERLSGFAPNKEESIAFDVVLKDGNVVHFNGGYFPIKYNYDKVAPSQRAQMQNQKDASDALLARRFGVASGSRYQSHTKNRVNQLPPGRELMLDIAVIEQSQNDIIHDICFREVTLDADRILFNSRISAGIQEKIGKDCYDMLRKWVKDNYAPQSADHSAFSDAMSFLRRNAAASTLALKVGWSLLNVGNFFLIGRRMGYGDTAKMLYNYAKHSDAEIEQLANHVDEWSPYMRSLEDNIEQNLKETLEENRRSDVEIKNKLIRVVRWATAPIRKYSYTLPTIVDRMTVKPYWLETYKAKYNECLEKGLDAKNAHDIAVDAGDEAVRNIVGSMRDIDLAQVQRTKNEMVKTLTMFYGYFSVVYNTFARDYYGNKGDASKMANAMLKTYIATCVADAMLAASWESAKAAAFDDDDFEKQGPVAYWVKKVGFGALGNAAETIPILRDAYREVDCLALTGRVQAPTLPQFRGSTNLVDAASKAFKDKYIDATGSFAEGVSIILGSPTNLVAWSANLAHAFNGDYTYTEALLASFMDKRLKTPNNKKKEVLY